MSALKTTTKLIGGAKLAPPLAKTGYKTAKPIVKRGAKPIVKRKTRKRLDEATDALAFTLATYAPRAARQLGLQPPKRKRTTPRVLAGVAIGAAGMYVLDPQHGAEHRKQLRKLLG